MVGEGKGPQGFLDSQSQPQRDNLVSIVPEVASYPRRPSYRKMVKTHGLTSGILKMEDQVVDT